jgi:signal transduction histidine kinase
LPTIKADPFLLKPAIGNLLSNAIKYAPENNLGTRETPVAE